MKITRTAFAQASAACVDIIAGVDTAVGKASSQDGTIILQEDLVITVTDEACLKYCRDEGSAGLCTKKFRSDLVVDDLLIPEVGTRLRCGSAVFVMTHRQKRCHGGCGLVAGECRLNGRVLFLKVIESGRLCVGDVLG